MEVIVIMSIFFFIVFLLFAIILAFAMAVRIVPEFQRLAVYRLGRYIGLRGPGIVFIIPLIDRVIPTNMHSDVTKAQAFEQMGGVLGNATTPIYRDGSVEVNGKIWDAISSNPISPGTQVRVTKVILEVEASDKFQ